MPNSTTSSLARKLLKRLVPLLLFVTVVAECALAHPGSGIVVDRQGNVYFTTTGRGVWKIDAQGRLTFFHPSGVHWLALDPQGSFSFFNFKEWFERITPPRSKPTLITGADSPFVINRDGNLYYPSTGAQMRPGGTQITRMTPDGKLALLTANPGADAERLGGQIGGILGLASGPDGSLYATYERAVQKIRMDGTAATLVNPVVVEGCTRDRHPSMPGPYLRGLAVDSDGAVYAAATGCGSVVKITPGGEVTAVFKAEPPWSPTGVAVAAGGVYVLEYDDPKAESGRGVPRVRKLGRDGTVRTLAVVGGKAKERQRLARIKGLDCTWSGASYFTPELWARRATRLWF